MKNKQTIIIILILLVVIGSITTLVVYKSRSQISGVLDAFARCLGEKQVTMYGSRSCSHCQREKARFIGSFKYVPYVECLDDPNRCLSAGIEGYPTWVLADGQKLIGEQGLQKLSEVSSCPLPQGLSDEQLFP